ncbi:hypothetical protein Tco_1365341 [Tanacetum coccineum]
MIASYSQPLTSYSQPRTCIPDKNATCHHLSGATWLVNYTQRRSMTVNAGQPSSDLRSTVVNGGGQRWLTASQQEILVNVAPSRNKAVVAKVSSNSSTPEISPDVAALWYGYQENDKNKVKTRQNQARE